MLKVGLELATSQLPLPLGCRGYRHVLPCLADLAFLVQVIFQGNLIADERFLTEKGVKIEITPW